MGGKNQWGSTNLGQKQRRENNKRINNANRRLDPKEAKNMRSKGAIDRINMYSDRVKVKNKKGKVIQTGQFQNFETETEVVRIAPNRKWFGASRVIGQTQLEKFRKEVGKKVHDPYAILLKQREIPTSLLTDANPEQKRFHILTQQSYEETFGTKSTRKRAKLETNVTDLASLVNTAQKKKEEYSNEGDTNLLVNKDNEIIMAKGGKRHKFKYGQTNRVYGEVYKVIDSSDVLIQVLDARDPQGTRNKAIEKYIRDNCKYKYVILLLNKCDLIPTWATARWYKYPTIAFRGGLKHWYGKAHLIRVLSQLSALMSNKQQISVGMFGYPNVGKSTVINTIIGRKCVSAAPTPGETRVWQTIKLTNRMYLIDCPGVVYNKKLTETELLLRGAIRVSKIKDPEQFIETILDRVKPDYIEKTYKIKSWVSTEDFLDQMSHVRRAYLRGNRPDYNRIAREIVYDFIRGDLPWFIRPPFEDEIKKAEEDRIAREQEDEKKAAWRLPKFEAVQVLEGIGNKFRDSDLRKDMRLSERLTETLNEDILAKRKQDMDSSNLRSSRRVISQKKKKKPAKK